MFARPTPIRLRHPLPMWPELRSDAGMSTVEYAIGTLAAAAFAAVLYEVVTNGSVASALGAMVQRALSVKL
jgi:hypothetical protein